jgi:hypothetical protein
MERPMRRHGAMVAILWVLVALVTWLALPKGS